MNETSQVVTSHDLSLVVSCVIHVWMSLVVSCLIHVWMTCHDLRATHTLKDMSTHEWHVKSWQVTTSHDLTCNTLQHTATHCNTLQHSVVTCRDLTCHDLSHSFLVVNESCHTIQDTTPSCDMTHSFTPQDMSTHTNLFCAGDLKGTHSLQHTDSFIPCHKFEHEYRVA